MEKQFKIGESPLTVKGVKADIEKITEQIKKLVGIKSYMLEKTGILGGEERETLLYVMFGQNALRNPEEFEVKKAEFLKWLASKLITVVDYPEIRTKVKEIFDAHVFINDLRLTEEQKQQQTIERNKIMAEHEAKREEERIKTDQEAEALKKEYPYLILTSQIGLSSRINATKNIRIELDKVFPGLIFSIKSESYSGGDSINVNWTDGASSEEVEKIVKKYEQGHFDGMNDIYEFTDRAFTKLFGGVKYLFCNRAVSPKRFQQVAEKLGYSENFTIKDEYTWELTGIDDKLNENRVHNEITREAHKTSFYVMPGKIEVSVQDIQNSQDGIRIQENKEHQGIEIVFDSKPSQDIIDRLKANRFRWNNRTKVWYSKLNANSLRFANSFVKPQIQETTENPEQGLEAESIQNFERELQTESRNERY